MKINIISAFCHYSVNTCQHKKLITWLHHTHLTTDYHQPVVVDQLIITAVDYSTHSDWLGTRMDIHEPSTDGYATSPYLATSSTIAMQSRLHTTTTVVLKLLFLLCCWYCCRHVSVDFKKKNRIVLYHIFSIRENTDIHKYKN